MTAPVTDPDRLIWPNTIGDMVARFWSLVDRSATSRDGCWEWQGHIGTTRGGYGRYRHQGQRWRAHRVAYALAHCLEPGQMQIMHKCNNPACCRPSHLYAGTDADNNRDRQLAGTQAMSAAVLAESDVINIRAMIDAGTTQQAIADQYGVHRTTIGDIATGRTWAHIPHEVAA